MNKQSVRILLYLYVCFTNLYAIRALLIETNTVLWTLLEFSMTASIIMHLYELERFFGKTTIFELKQDPVYNMLVFVDKFAAYTTIALTLYLKTNAVFHYIEFAVLAVIVCVISTELNYTKRNVVAFALLHGTWHLMAFHLAYLYCLFPNPLPQD